MKKINVNIQQLLSSVVLGTLLLTTPVVYAAVPEKNVPEKTEEMVTVSGVVRDAATRVPLAGVRIVAHGNTNYTAMTNEEGSYSLQVPKYVTLLDFVAPGYNLIQMSVSEKHREVYIYSEDFSGDYDVDIQVADKAEAGDFALSTALTIDQEIKTRLGGDVRSITRGGTPAMGAAMFIGGLKAYS